MGTLSQRAIEKVSGPSWDDTRDKFMTIAETLLSVSPNAKGDLTTIYVKFTVSPDVFAEVYAVVWIKTSKRLVVGLALPQTADMTGLGSAPPGTRYKGLTGYFSVTHQDAIPDKLSVWAIIAYESVMSAQ